ncbi:LysR family transcriptional regulator [Ancylobacter defluvii]|uniref:LysR family transcriptional regulator n=1 Tax=Ancylobacter defluvii TaxID=1282440 RepID=A0A9W6JT40_9HYPH|nr:LysR family transcriptional regulator [Ancylobacter defluvii]MBS7590419.1 LysR family transcriptional regulator [Ancylobacter defluvii]GLK83340.1 LysR family transcriptional regulator [Ancylobacter defluvii]
MTLEQLRIFVAVAARQHVTKGAADLNLTQSATSAAIAALEARYATRLFDRIGRRIELTEAGRLFLVEAKAVLAQAAAAEKVLVDLAGLAHGSLALVASQTIAGYWLPRQVQRFRARHPGISVAIAVGNTDFVAGQVRLGEADLGFAEGEVDEPALAVLPVARDEMVLVTPVTHSWAWRPPAAPEQLLAGPWVLREPGSGTRAVLEAHLASLGLSAERLNVALEYPSNEAVRAAVEAGSGVTVLSRRVAASAIRAGTLAEIAFPLPTRRFLALRHKERYRTRAAQAFLDLVAETDGD